MASNFKLLLIFLVIWNFFITSEAKTAELQGKLTFWFWVAFCEKLRSVHRETTVLVIMVFGLVYQANIQIVLLEKRKITNLIECDFCHMELWGKISAVTGKILNSHFSDFIPN